MKPTLRSALRRFADEETCPVADHCAPGFVSGAYWGWGSARIRIGALLKSIPASGLPDSAVCFFKDGNKMCCVFGDFIDLQASPAGFGDNFEDALADLRQAAQETTR